MLRLRTFVKMTNTTVKSHSTSSDSNGIIFIPQMEGYEFITGVAYATNSTQPLDVIRIGDNVYSGYYGSATTPTAETPFSVLFTPVSNCTVILYYMENN